LMTACELESSAVSVSIAVTATVVTSRAISAITAAHATVTAATASILTRLGFVHSQRTTSHFLIVQCLNCRICICISHFNKAKPTKPTGFPVIDHGDRDNFAIRFEHFSNRVLICRKRQVSYVNPFGQLEPSPELEMGAHAAIADVD
jgi:hypothetical protein